jgi:hypothetical protein
MSSFVAFRSQQIYLADRSRSSFTLVYLLCVQVRIFFLLAMLMRDANGKSRPMRARCPTKTRMHRVDAGGILL